MYPLYDNITNVKTIAEINLNEIFIHIPHYIRFNGLKHPLQQYFSV
jgi:hypothetical protein